MHKSLKNRSNRTVLPPPIRPYSDAAGNVLIYVVVLMLIFGVLGVVMVSLFTSSTASTVTRNDTRRARYMAESGMRYAFSEMRKADFDMNLMIDTLNTITYKIGSTETFTINVFSPWMDSSRTQSSPFDGPLTLLVPVGEIPPGYVLPPNNIYAINYEFTGKKPTEPGGVAEISSVAGQTLTTIDLNLNQVFNAGKEERICLAVKPTQDQTVSDGGNLYVAPEAAEIFPRFGGAFSIGRNEYFYEERIDDAGNSRVILTNLSKRPDAAWGISAATSDYVIMSPRNYLVVPTGTSDGTAYGGDYLFGKGIYDASLIRPGSRQPDITTEDLLTSLSEQESDTRFFEKNLVDSTLEIGRGTSDEFGSAFFEGDMFIGGDQGYCEQGACLFSLGVRVFFLLDFEQQGDGITFTLLSKGFGALGPPNNSASSVGGDFELSELMGYAGDSRLVADPDPSNNSLFLASNPEDRGLDPPKIAVEFDTRTNNNPDDPPPDYCSGANANVDTRNDPLTGNKDAVQYVFWGRTGFLNIPCRDNNTLYDDNRHDADGEEPTEEWRFEGASAAYSAWRPAIGPDGTIYVSALDATLYALNKDGSQKWTFDLTDNNEYMPAVDPDTGTIYSDIHGSALVAINPDGSEKWRFLIIPSSDVGSTPTVGPDGVIYFGTDNSQELIALYPNGTLKWRFATIGAVDNVAALNSDASVVYFVATDRDTSNTNAMLYAVNTATGLERWRFPLVAENNELTSSPTVDTKGTANPGDDVIYVGDDDNYLYAFRPAARSADPVPAPPLGTFPGPGEWRFRTNGEIESSAAVDPTDGTIYIGSDDFNVWAINPNGTEKWRFPTGNEVESSPFVDLDGTVYIGSTDGNVYAINPNRTLKWIFPTGGRVPSSAVTGVDGFIHIGSNDTNFYTISQFADPRNFKDEDKTAGKLLTVEDLGTGVAADSNTDWLNGASSKGSWAVRMEVECLLRDVNEVCTANADGDYEYELRLWLRQCPDQDDFPCSNILGTFYQDTRVEYDYTAVQDLPMLQRIKLNATEQAAFERFFFGFTGAAGAEALDATVSQFELSFIRPGDPVVACDSTSWPVEPPLADCI
ncbi:MAG: PQQ-binding-like beta-propeller repeat protein, partial [Deltaproteobacteria bacterium]